MFEGAPKVELTDDEVSRVLAEQLRHAPAGGLTQAEIEELCGEALDALLVLKIHAGAWEAFEVGDIEARWSPEDDDVIFRVSERYRAVPLMPARTPQTP